MGIADEQFVPEALGDTLPTATAEHSHLPVKTSQARSSGIARVLAAVEPRTIIDTAGRDIVQCPALFVDEDASYKEFQTNSVPAWLSRLTLHCGMHSDAWTGWAMISKQPHMAFTFSVLANLFTLLTNSHVLMFESKPFRWEHHAPATAYVLLHSTSSLIILRKGPAGAKTKLYYAALIPAILIQVAVTARLMLGRMEHVPFTNRLLFAVVNCMVIWCWAFTSTVGSWAPDHPPNPFETLMEPIADATVRSLRLTDAITDMLIIRTMLEMAEEPCYWFGYTGRCSSWSILAIFAGIFAVIDLASGLFLAMSGSGVGRSHVSKRMKKVYTVAHIVSFACKLAILTVTLIKLSSEFKAPAEDMSAAEKRNAITVTLASFTITIITFSITMLGMQKMVFAADRVASFVRSCVSKATVLPGDQSTPEAIAPTGARP